MTQINRSRDPVRDSALRAFLAVAAAGSFTGAAKVLSVGQPAVSHAISRLEAALGVTVFVRTRSGVGLTSAGRDLREAIVTSFSDIDAAVERTLGARRDAEVTLSVSTSLASYWLMPRLHDFKRRHPEIGLRVITTDSDRDVGRDDADLWIPLGSVQSAGLDSIDFCDEELVPVASPDLALALKSHAPEDLLKAPLLHLEERYETRFDWVRWFGHHGVGVGGELPGYRSNDYSIILQAALEAQGIALGWRHIVGSLIEDGRLVAIGETISTNRPFPILMRRSRNQSQSVLALRSWLGNQFG